MQSIRHVLSFYRHTELPKELKRHIILLDPYAVRVRPFNASEQMRLPQASTSKFNFSADASLASLGAGHGRGDGSDSSAHTGSKGQAGIRKVVDVLDDSVLVFDPPDAESISKYKRALLPVQAYRRFKDMRYAFDRVFHEDAQQEEVSNSRCRRRSI